MSISNHNPIFKVPQKAWWVLLSLDYRWGYEKEDEFISFSSPSVCIPLLPLLELSYPEAVILVQQGLNQAGADLNLLSIFPFNDLLHLALNWETDYWVSLAVRWLENGYPISEELVDCLKPWQEEKKHSQGLRHRAQRLIKQYENSQND